MERGDGKVKKKNNVTQMPAPNASLVRRTLWLMLLFVVVTFAILIGRLYQLQIVDREKYKTAAVEQQLRETTLTASRGTIYDANMQILAMSAGVSTVFISPAELVKYEETDMKAMITSRLSEILDVDYDTIWAKWDRTSSWYETVAYKVEPDVADEVVKLKNEYDLKSVHVSPDSKRYYPNGSLASQIVGFVGRDNNGLEGIEAVYDEELQGENGRIVRVTAENGVDLIYTGYENYYDATDGKSLVLTVDSNVQHYLEKNLSQAIDDYQLENGAMGIVMNVKTGAILGMTSLPNYDPNNYQSLNEETLAELNAQELSDEDYNAAVTNALLKQWRNRPISDTYEPGSTFKIMTLAMGLEEGVITENDTFYCGGNMEVKGRTDPLWCWNHAGHGTQTLAQAAQHSCNVAFVNMGLRIGAKKFYDYIEAFGFFGRTGIDLYGESTGVWWSHDVFEDPQNFSQLASASFGQTFNITPIQLITAVSAVANGGYLMQPYIVSKVLDNEGNVVENHEPKALRQVISEDTSRRVCAILESVVGTKEGTGKNAYVAGYRVAGKTGTAENVTREVQTGMKSYWVSFIGFAPADDPQVAVLVVLDSPSLSSGIYISGGGMAAPVVGRIMADVLPYLGVEQVFDSEEAANADVKVPAEKGRSIADARQELEDKGFTVRVVGDGSVVTDQAPMANVSIAAGSSVILYAGSDKPSDTVEVPALNGMSYAQAKARLEVEGLFIRSVGAAPSTSWNIVVSGQAVTAGSEVAYGSVIQVTLIDNDSSVAGEGFHG